MAKNGAVKKKQKQTNSVLDKRIFVVIVLNFPFFIQKGLLRSSGKHPSDQLFPEALTEIRDCTCLGSMVWSLDHLRTTGVSYSERGLLSRKRMINWWSFSINYYSVINGIRGLLPIFFFWELEEYSLAWY